MRALEKLTERREAEGTPEAELAAYVDSAAAERPRLNPHAVDRIETKLAELDAATPGRVWRGLRAPAYVLATALVAVVMWAELSPRLTGSAIAPPAPVAVAPHTAPPVVAAAHPLRLDTGSLEVRSDRAPVLVETPRARVEVAPGSAVRITVEEHGVRIAASAGSARVFYSDGRVELVLPAPPAHAAVHHPRTHASAADTAPIEPAASTAPVRIDGERASFGAAMARMRNAPAEALGLLDAHLSRYPDGATRVDAERARIAVLLRLSRKGEALDALDHARTPSTELLVMRAELRAEAQRYDEAVGDFGAVLVADEDRFAPRALYGRALVRQKQGDRARMTADLERYLLLYPRGEFADRARAELRHATSEASR